MRTTRSHPPTFPLTPAAGGREPAPAAGREWVQILQEDPDLGETLTGELLTRARRMLRAPVLILERNAAPPPELGSAGQGFGLLILSGLLGRRVSVGRGHATELLGPGDILRPWDEHDHLQSVPPEVRWRVFQRARLAELGPDITRLIGQRPELLIAFSGRLLHRARCGAYLNAVSHLGRVEEKVLVTLWHLGSRWGRVTPRGLAITFRLTHEVIGEIVGAQRPTITIALTSLRRRGILARNDDGTLTLLGSSENWDLPRPAMPLAAEDARITAG